MKFNVDLGEVRADFHDVVVVSLVADLFVDFCKNIDPSFHERDDSGVISLNNLQLFVHLCDSGLDAVVLGHVAIAYKELECFLVLGIAQLENFNCVCFRCKWFDLWPLHIKRVEFDSLLVHQSGIEGILVHKSFYLESKQVLIVVAHRSLHRTLQLFLGFVSRNDLESRIEKVLGLRKLVLIREVLSEVHAIASKVFAIV